MKQLLVMAGEGEYRSAVSMRAIADLLDAELDVTIEYKTPDVMRDMPDFPESTFGGLDGLSHADLLIIFTRMRRLPHDEMEALDAYCRRGGNIIGLRTSSHAFRYPSSSRWATWNDGFGRDVLGTPWVSHHGQDTHSEVTKRDGVRHEIIDDLPHSITVRSWLYRTDMSSDCRPLLWGRALGDDTVEDPEPVAWTRTPGDQRIFFTSLGHAEDLAVPAVQRLLVNATTWALT